MKVYIASSLHNAERVRYFKKKFEDHGVAITYDWTTHGMVTTEEELRKCGAGERDGVLDCHLLFLIQPARMGAHWEGGLAMAKNIPIVILEEVPVEQKTFYYLDNVFKFTAEDDAFNHALKLLKGIT
jgi:hypothetical protein